MVNSTLCWTRVCPQFSWIQVEIISEAWKTSEYHLCAFVSGLLCSPSLRTDDQHGGAHPIWSARVCRSSRMCGRVQWRHGRRLHRVSLVRHWFRLPRRLQWEKYKLLDVEHMQYEHTQYEHQKLQSTISVLTHCGRVTQICVFNAVNLGTSANSP